MNCLRKYQVPYRRWAIVMSKAYKVVAKMIPVGERKGETVYTVSPVSYGLLITDEVAKQISTECTATPADVKAVLDALQYEVITND